MTPLARVLQQTARQLEPHRAALAEAWMRALAETQPGRDPGELRRYCVDTVGALLSRLARGEVEELLHEESEAARAAAHAGRSFHPDALAIRLLDRCCLPYLLRACPDRESLAEGLLALDELGDRRLELLLQAQEEEAHRRLLEAQEQAAGAAERARDLARANEALRRSEAGSQHRAEQIGMLSLVVHRIAGILDVEELMQEAADAIQARMDHTFVAVLILDEEGLLLGRWAGRTAGGRSTGRTQRPAGGVIGRALRKRAPQVVPDVSRDPDYFEDVPGTASELAIPLLEAGDVIGALDFQSEEREAFGLEDVAVGETLAEFLVVALRNARLLAEARRPRS